MTGKIKLMIDKLIEMRSQGNESIASTTRTKLLLKGIDIKKFTKESEDDPVIINTIQQIAKEMGLQLQV
jgi:hypothetical protein